ncbi:MAG: metal-dependent hydrolase [Kiritimatiellia bacterium]
MKGFSHFMSGVAVASFGPWAIEAAQQGNPIFFVLGGACGILPDTLDFKFYRFFYHHDVYVTPDPKAPDPQYVADEIARAIALAVDEKRYINLKLVSVRLGADFWQQYSVKFDNEKMEVAVKFGPVVNTGQVPVEGTENRYPAVARAKIRAKVIQTYDAALKVDIFDGPSVGLKPMENGDLDLEFLPWHREWSHSLTIGAMLGVLVGALAFFVSGWAAAWQCFVTIAACYGVHVVEDQLGHMGSNIFYPLTKLRTPGLHWMHSGDGLPNFLTVWISCLLIFWNLYRGQPAMTYHFSFVHLMMVGLVVPGLAFWALRWLLNRGQKVVVAKGDDADDEWNESKAAG